MYKSVLSFIMVFKLSVLVCLFVTVENVRW